MELPKEKVQALINDWSEFVENGSWDALSKVYFFYYDYLYDYGIKLTPDQQVVEDAIQNEFLNLIKYRKSIQPVENLSGYLISAFRRQLLTDIKKQKKMILHNSKESDGDEFNYYRLAINPEEEHEDDFESAYQAVKQSVENLTERQQEIIFLRFEKGISYNEIADMLGISVDSCYKLLYRSVKTIKQEIENRFGKITNIVLWFLQKYIR